MNWLSGKNVKLIYPMLFCFFLSQHKRKKRSSQRSWVANLIFMQTFLNQRCRLSSGQFRIESESTNMGKGKYKIKLEFVWCESILCVLNVDLTVIKSMKVNRTFNVCSLLEKKVFCGIVRLLLGIDLSRLSQHNHHH